MRVGFPLGIFLALVGYAFFYSGYSNLATDGHGTGVIQGLTGHDVGIDSSILGSLKPNVSGNTPQTGPPQVVQYV